jgi:hypothetical protein
MHSENLERELHKIVAYGNNENMEQGKKNKGTLGLRFTETKHDLPFCCRGEGTRVQKTSINAAAEITAVFQSGRGGTLPHNLCSANIFYPCDKKKLKE